MSEEPPTPVDDDAERELEADPRFEEVEETLQEGETEVIFGKWIPGSLRPKESEPGTGKSGR
jgi:hypothetical protein